MGANPAEGVSEDHFIALRESLLQMCKPGLKNPRSRSSAAARAENLWNDDKDGLQ